MANLKIQNGVLRKFQTVGGLCYSTSVEEREDTGRMEPIVHSMQSWLIRDRNGGRISLKKLARYSVL